MLIDEIGLCTVPFDLPAVTRAYVQVCDELLAARGALPDDERHQVARCIVELACKGESNADVLRRRAMLVLTNRRR
jgi:hypothetical protein